MVSLRGLGSAVPVNRVVPSAGSGCDMPVNFLNIALTARQQYTYICMTATFAVCNIGVSKPVTRFRTYLNKLFAYLVYLKWRYKFKHREGFSFLVVLIGSDKTLTAQEADRQWVYGEIRTVDYSPAQCFKTQPGTMTETVAFGSEWRETSARLHGARKSPTPTHASTLSTLPPTNSRVAYQTLTSYLPSMSHLGASKAHGAYVNYMRVSSMHAVVFVKVKLSPSAFVMY